MQRGNDLMVGNEGGVSKASSFFSVALCRRRSGCSVLLGILRLPLGWEGFRGKKGESQINYLPSAVLSNAMCLDVVSCPHGRGKK